jgi:STE24 endopeptidase
MNEYAVYVLIALFACYGLETLADALNLRALSPRPPEPLAHLVDGERYARSQEYVRHKTRFSLVSRTFDLALLLVFWLAGGFGWLDELVRGFGFGPIGTGLCFLGVLLLARTVLGLPFGWYHTFVIEERFGFNRTTASTFWGDRVKGLLLGVALGGPLLAAILLFFERTGDAAWLWCWTVTAAFTVIVQFVAPTWIFPLFNKFEPLEDGELRQSLLSYAGNVDFPLRDVYVIDGSRRSSKANAFFTGFGKNKRVALFDTLIEKHRPAELVAIVAHEIGHFKRGHILKALLIGILQMGVVFYLLSVVIGHRGLFEAFAVETPSTYVGLVVFGLLYAPLDLALSGQPDTAPLLRGPALLAPAAPEARAGAAGLIQDPDARRSSAARASRASNVSTSCVAVDSAMAAGCFEARETPMGQCTVSISSSGSPRCARRFRKRAHLRSEPIRPTNGKQPRLRAATRISRSSGWLCVITSTRASGGRVAISASGAPEVTRRKGRASSAGSVGCSSSSSRGSIRSTSASSHGDRLPSAGPT